jgi:hypothetical protein
VELMIRMYCRDHHGDATAQEAHQTGTAPERDHGVGKGSPLCPDCVPLLDYSLARIDACRFGSAKPTCARCTVHCYRPAMRTRIKAAMRYSGPRMTYRHPYLALCHLMDRRHEPEDAD